MPRLCLSCFKLSYIHLEMIFSVFPVGNSVLFFVVSWLLGCSVGLGRCGCRLGLFVVFVFVVLFLYLILLVIRGFWGVLPAILTGTHLCVFFRILHLVLVWVYVDKTCF